MRPRPLASLLSVAALGVVAVTGVALAHDGASSSDGVIDNAKITHDHHAADHQHGEVEGHLPPSESDNIRLVSSLALKNVEPGKIADVGVHKGYAYLAAWGGETCKYNGVHVVDIRDVTKPKEVAFIQAKEGSAPGEGVQALSINTKAFKGDILVTNNETCNEKTGFGGLNIYNVTNPRNPSSLTEGFGDETVPGQGKKAANEIHSVFAWQAGDKAYAVIVDNDEGADIDILDISDPRKPKIVSETDADETWPGIVQNTPANLTQIFHHDVIVKEIDGKQIMLVSYWDGGYLKLDVTNPAVPRLVADSDFPNPDTELLAQTGETEAPEGNAHQAEFTLDNQYILAADEDFNPYAFDGSIAGGASFAPIPGDATRALAAGQTITGTPVYVGRACLGDTAVPAAGAPGRVAVVMRGLCTFDEKVANVVAAGGYEAVIVINREGADACGAFAMSVSGDIVTVSAPRSVGYDLFGVPGYVEASCLAGSASEIPGLTVGQAGANAVSLRSYFDGWGYVRLFRNGGGKLQQLDTYAIPEAMDESKASGFGDLSVHEVATSLVDSSLVYISYYAGGLRVIDVDGGTITEVGHYIADGGNNFWGVQAFMSGGKEYIAMSDRDMGLFIFQYTP